jgi:hypothetical protein
MLDDGRVEETSNKQTWKLCHRTKQIGTYAPNHQLRIVSFAGSMQLIRRSASVSFSMSMPHLRTTLKMFGFVLALGATIIEFPHLFSNGELTARFAASNSCLKLTKRSIIEQTFQS